MKEGNVILMLILIFAVAGLFVFFISAHNFVFNFYKSDVNANGKTITEKLYFNTDKPYHTLYRNFASHIYSSPVQEKNFIEIKNVTCSAGVSYMKDYYGRCILFNGESSCPAYTEPNEYGCSFGNSLGFSSNKEYWIQATYELHPENLFTIDGKNYIKVVIYSAENHNKLDSGNFFTPADFVRNNKYSYSEDVIVYVPYSGNDANIVPQKSFEFDKNNSQSFFFLVFTLLPAIIIFLSWYFLGREKTFVDVPPELSYYPNERKAWEVAAYFNPPFSKIDKNFFSAMLIDFFHRKIIDLKSEEKDVWMKLTLTNQKLDKIEQQFLDILRKLYEKDTTGYAFWKKTLVKNGWVDLKNALSANKYSNQAAFVILEKDIKKWGKTYIDTKGETVVSVMAAVLFFFGMFFLGVLAFILGVATFYLIPLYIIFMLVISIVSSRTTLFIKFKDSYYAEYQHWKAFKKYLSNSFSIKNNPYKGVVIWDKFLVYGTALGVSEKVIRELKNQGILTDRYYGIYMGVYYSSPGFMTSSGMAGSGGFGGAGGGGIGGGGGGGR